jgi:hypothetical protein
LPGLFGILLLLKSWLFPIGDVGARACHSGSAVVCFPAPPGQSGNECKLRAGLRAMAWRSGAHHQSAINLPWSLLLANSVPRL